MKELERISKTYYSSSKKESVAVVIPKAVRDLVDIKPGDYIKWVCTVREEEIEITIHKV